MNQSQLKRMYKKGYRYGLNVFKGNASVPMLCVKKTSEIARLLDKQYKGYKCTHFQISPEGEILTQTMQTTA